MLFLQKWPEGIPHVILPRLLFPYRISVSHLKNIDLTLRGMGLLIHSPILAYGWVASQNVTWLLKIILISVT